MGKRYKVEERGLFNRKKRYTVEEVEEDSEQKSESKSGFGISGCGITALIVLVSLVGLAIGVGILVKHGNIGNFGLIMIVAGGALLCGSLIIFGGAPNKRVGLTIMALFFVAIALFFFSGPVIAIVRGHSFSSSDIIGSIILVGAGIIFIVLAIAVIKFG